MEKKYFVWGTGSFAKRMNICYAEELKQSNIVGYIDNDVNKQGKVFFGKKVFSPNILLEERDCCVAIATYAEMSVRKQIEKDYPWISSRVEGIEFYRKLQLLNRYKDSTDEEIQEIVNYLRKNPLEVFNYDFTKKYMLDNIEVCVDDSNGLYYVVHRGKKMYFARTFTCEEQVRSYYRSVCLEQDDESPHKYLTEEFTVSEDAIVVDAGVAEGNFSLEIVDRVKKIYLFEPDDNWIEALQYTFAPYKDKVQIINKCVSNYVDDVMTTIDNEVGGGVDFIKMDVEGEEYYALEGAKKAMESTKDIKCIVCTYHHELEYEAIKGFFLDRHFDVETSKGYMWYPSEQPFRRNPVLRRGLVRAERKLYEE